MAAKKAAKKTAKKPAKKAAKKLAKKTAPKKVSAIPKGYRTVTPTMNQTDARATIDFCIKVFGAKLRSSMPGPDGKLMHAELQIGDSLVMLSDSVMEPARVSSIFLYVPDADKTIAKALSEGAKLLMPAATMFWGDRFGRIADPFGNLWAIATHVEDVSPREMKKRAAAEAERMAARAPATQVEA